MTNLPRYDHLQSYEWNYDNAPDPVEVEVPTLPGPEADGRWRFVGLPVDSPLGMPAGPLLNGKWCLYYASLGFDIVTYKTVRSRYRACYPLPNLLPVECGQIDAGPVTVPSSSKMQGNWAVSFGMPSKAPDVWRPDVEATRATLPSGKLLSVSVVGTIQEGWSLEQLAEDYALCARMAVESGADVVETNFSCPNVATCDGQLYQQPLDAQLVAECVRAAIGNTPLVVKVGHIPNAEQAAQLVAVLAPSASAIATTNCIAVKVSDAEGDLHFDGQVRGIGGTGIQTATLNQVRLLTNAIREQQADMQVVGVGGISTAQHVASYLQAGASAVHIATAAMRHPMLAVELKEQLQAGGDCFLSNSV